MSAISQAIYDLLVNDATLVGLLSTYGGNPAVFTSDPAPGDATLPYIVTAGEVSHAPFDTKTTLGRRFLRDVRCYADADGSAVDVEEIAERVRALLHRQELTVSGFDWVLSECSGPIAADERDAYGRIVTVAVTIEESAPAPDWWDPLDVGLSIVGAYRAINTSGSPWIGGPTGYAQTLINLANPGVNDLVEGNGAVTWAQDTGWQFSDVQAKYFITGIVPTNDQDSSMLVQVTNLVSDGRLAGMDSGVDREFYLWSEIITAVFWYANGQRSFIGGALAAANYGVAGNQGYLNGVASGGAIGAWGGTSDDDIYIGAYNLAGVGAQSFVSARIRAVAIYSEALSAPQMLAVATAMGQL